MVRTDGGVSLRSNAPRRDKMKTPDAVSAMECQEERAPAHFTCTLSTTSRKRESVASRWSARTTPTARR